MSEKKIRVIVAKPGLDGHDRGAKVVARALRDAGMEVIYLGLQQTPEDIVNSAIQEDADFIGISSLAGAHMTHFTRVLQLLKEKESEDILVIGGGIIPEDDREKLLEAGVAALFEPGAPTQTIIDEIKKIKEASAAAAAS
ncbi:MAG TPA: cobalamin B12-binding domain-containing protein [bacterium]|nr:MAG: Methylmalonyl-CoA mutase [bacterium ADurb.Bin236]HOY63012.1 cobalamin B12-binding domain-containing protein [bacterium]HPI75147.1 cobalamin B12-binding domain-containing protein [bacterium]HPN94481.1 cobalamin B12-binding domain-containing protein [bacterium]